MNSLFFYGTLCHLPLLEAVLERPLRKGEAIPARLTDHVIYWVKDEPFPVIIAQPGEAQGILLNNLSEDDVARLDFYEGGYGYALKELRVSTEHGQEPARVYFPDPGMWTPAAPWNLQDWVDQWGAMTVFAAQEEMHYFGRHSAAQVARMFPMVRARATAKLNARTHNRALSPSGFSDSHVMEHNRSYPYSNFFAMADVSLSHDRFDGGRIGPVDRAVFVATDAVIVLPYDPVRDRVLLIEQFRAGAYVRGDALPWQLEPIAGRVDAGENAETTAHREAMEEAGLVLTSLEEVAHCYASPGASTEYFDIYVGLADLPDDITGEAGLEGEQEDIRSHLFSFDALMDMVDTMQAVNAPLVLASLWLARHRERLRTG